MPVKVTAEKVLEAKTPAAAAKRFHTWLTETWDARGAVLWSPAETKERGWGSGWSVCWEEGPFEWTMVSAGSDIGAGETGCYSTPGPFPTGLRGEGWMAEPYNGFVLGFYPA
jgi:hypothetical protein